MDPDFRYEQGGMLKHVSITPWRGRADSVSLSSSGGASSCGSGSPTPGHTPPPSRASSCASLAPLTALSSFSPADTAPQQVSTLWLYSHTFAGFTIYSEDFRRIVNPGTKTERIPLDPHTLNRSHELSINILEINFFYFYTDYLLRWRNLFDKYVKIIPGIFFIFNSKRNNLTDVCEWKHDRAIIII